MSNQSERSDDNPPKINNDLKDKIMAKTTVGFKPKSLLSSAITNRFMSKKQKDQNFAETQKEIRRGSTIEPWYNKVFKDNAIASDSSNYNDSNELKIEEDDMESLNSFNDENNYRSKVRR